MAHEREDHHGDLAWARALAAGDTAALVRYEQELVPMIASHLRRRGHTPDEAADIQQTLRARLLVDGGAGAPAVAGYEGRCALRSWVLVIALREAVRVRQRSAREPALDDDDLVALAERSDTTVADALDKARYRDVFRIAFRTALATLTPLDRNLLRMNVLDGVSIDGIAAVHGVHRATAARWLDRARETVALAVRRDVMRQLGADPFEADDLLRWVQSRIDLSLTGLATP
ncbi:MAG: sigma-70 family RNA polymerase sigma factor [Deltaproteobacteria bacterium]|nr:sigma-70 family RNA polymerase sigma factor [Deltaproteobacteria bacterium]